MIEVYKLMTGKEQIEYKQFRLSLWSQRTREKNEQRQNEDWTV